MLNCTYSCVTHVATLMKMANNHSPCITIEHTMHVLCIGVSVGILYMQFKTVINFSAPTCSYIIYYSKFDHTILSYQDPTPLRGTRVW